MNYERVQITYELILADLRSKGTIHKMLYILNEKELEEDYEACQGIINAIKEFEKTKIRK